MIYLAALDNKLTASSTDVSCSLKNSGAHGSCHSTRNGAFLVMSFGLFFALLAISFSPLLEAGALYVSRLTWVGGAQERAAFHATVVSDPTRAFVSTSAGDASNVGGFASSNSGFAGECCSHRHTPQRTAVLYFLKGENL